LPSKPLELAGLADQLYERSALPTRGGKANQFFMESLILAQDERWRRA
jgi:hypothetical protein